MGAQGFYLEKTVFCVCSFFIHSINMTSVAYGLSPPPGNDTPGSHQLDRNTCGITCQPQQMEDQKWFCFFLCAVCKPLFLWGLSLYTNTVLFTVQQALIEYPLCALHMEFYVDLLFWNAFLVMERRGKVVSPDRLIPGTQSVELT